MLKFKREGKQRSEGPSSSRLQRDYDATHPSSLWHRRDKMTRYA